MNNITHKSKSNGLRSKIESWDLPIVMNKGGGNPEKNNNNLKGGGENNVLQKNEESMINIIMLQNSQIKKKTVTGVDHYKCSFILLK